MKHALVVYESMFGNTATIARAIGDGLRSGMRVEVVEVGAAPTTLDGEVDLLVVGGPTHAFGMSRQTTRADAGRQGADRQAAAGIGLREWVEQLTVDGAVGPLTAAFDTKVKRPKLPGSAARAAQKQLRRAGFRPVVPAANFYVGGTPGPLTGGETERARAWGERLASIVSSAGAQRLT
jgi:hypothetical protein